MLNAAAGGGAKHSPTQKGMLKCGEAASYAKLRKKKATRKNQKKATFERDHVPAKATLTQAAYRRAVGVLSKARRKCIAAKIERDGIAVAIPRAMHRKHSRTCGSKNKKLKMSDSKTKKSLADAKEKDLADMEAAMKGTPCEAAYKEAADKVRKHDHEKTIQDALDACP